MVELQLLNVAIWACAIGLLVFCVIYSVLASPWRDSMGRHVLAFMGGLCFVFIYYIFATIVRDDISMVWLLRGWIITIFMLAILIWWRVVIFLKYQIMAREREEDNR